MRRTKSFWWLVLLLASVSINVRGFAANFFTLIPNTANIVITAGFTGQVTYQVDNTSGTQLGRIIYDPNYPRNTGIRIDQDLTNCGSALAPAASCDLTLTIQAPNQSTVYFLSPRVCSDNGLICSIPTSENRTKVVVVTTPPIPLNLSVDLLPGDQRLQFRALELENTGVEAVTLNTITTTLVAALQGKVEVCDASTSCTPPTGLFPVCTNGSNLSPAAHCLIWFRSVDNVNQPLEEISGTVALRIATSPTTVLNTTTFTIDYSNSLYAGGRFTTAGGQSVNRIARWNGTIWSALGTGMNGNVRALSLFNGDLIAGGQFTNAGGNSANRIAQWNGTGWNALGVGMNNTVRALTTFNNNLIAGGQFTNAGGNSANRIARWNGMSWSALNTGMNNQVRALTVFNNNLIAGGQFTNAGGNSANRIAQWNGASWSALSTGMNNQVRALTIFNNNLIAGGQFTNAGGGSANRIAQWDGASWSALGSGITGGPGPRVFALVQFNNNLVAGGRFTTAGGSSANQIAQWNGFAWSNLGSGMNERIFALSVDVNNLFVGGRFTSAGGNPANGIAQWNGSTWSALSTGMNNRVFALLTASSLNIH
jgi:hypothetical protein